MKTRKTIREKGKLKLSRYFQEFKDGESVAVVREVSLHPHFPLRLQGSTGKIKGKQGRAYIVEINTQNKPKQFLIEPIHLKKIVQIK
jgi:ribosomal protein L21E